MNVQEVLAAFRIDGKPVGEILKVELDAEQTTVIYLHQSKGGERIQRVITVETEAVTFE